MARRQTIAEAFAAGNLSGRQLMSGMIGAGLGGAVDFAGGALNAFLSSTVSEVTYAGNFLAPFAVPPPELAISLFHQGQIKYPELWKMLRWHAIDWQPNDEDTDRALIQRTWYKATDMARPIFPLDDYLREHWKGRVTRPMLLDRMKRHGIIHREEVDLFTGQYELLPWPIALELWLAGQLDEEKLDEVLAAAGFQRQQDRDSLKSLSDWPALEETRRLINRGFVPFNRRLTWLRRGGAVSEEAQAAQLELAKEIPTIPEIVLYAHRGVWDQRIVDAYDLDAEQPPELEYWAGKLGFNWADAPPGRNRVPWPTVFWRASKQLMPLSYVYEAVRRLRPGRVERFVDTLGQPLVEGNRPFTYEDLRFHLFVAQFPKPVRDWLAAINTRPLSRVDIRRSHYFGLTSNAEASEYYQDLGYVPADAQKLVELSNALAYPPLDAPDPMRIKRYRNRLAQRSLDAYKAGIASREQTANNLLALGWLPETVEAALTDVDASWTLQQTEEYKRRLKQEYLSGKRSGDETRRRLEQIGVIPEAVERIMGWWGAMLSERRKFFSATQIVEAVCKHWITFEDGKERLRNLGWNEPDALLWLGKAQACVQKQQIAMVKADAQQRRSAAKELMAVQKAQQKQLADTQATLRRIMPPPHLQKWYKAGGISRERFLEVMRAEGFEQAAAELWASEVEDGTEQRQASGTGTAEKATGAAP